ncbi:hypothetical protein DFH08DRAFT_928109, partial [Mycena albidolilacea]
MRFMENEAMVQARFSRLLEAMSIFANEVKLPTPRRGPFWYHHKVFTCADSESIRPDFVGGKLKHNRTWPFTKKLTAVKIKMPPVMKQLLDKLERKRDSEWQEVEWGLTAKTPEWLSLNKKYHTWVVADWESVLLILSATDPHQSCNFVYFYNTLLSIHPEPRSAFRYFRNTLLSTHPESHTPKAKFSPAESRPKEQLLYSPQTVQVFFASDLDQSELSFERYEEHTMFDIAQENIQYGKLWSGWEGDGIPKFYGPATKIRAIRLKLERSGPTDAISIILAKLHARGFEHADLAARNVIRDANGKISFIDFAELRPTAQKSEGERIALGKSYSLRPLLPSGRRNRSRSRSRSYGDVGDVVYFLTELYLNRLWASGRSVVRQLLLYGTPIQECTSGERPTIIVTGGVGVCRKRSGFTVASTCHLCAPPNVCTRASPMPAEHARSLVPSYNREMHLSFCCELSRRSTKRRAFTLR